MLLDAFAIFSDAQAITASAASSNVMDLAAPGTPVGWTQAIRREIGPGEPIPLVIRVVTAFATLTSLAVKIEADNDEAFGSATTVASSPSIAAASLVAGYRFPLNWIPTGVYERYLRIYYAVTGSNATAGAIDAFIPSSVQDNYTP